MPNIFTVAERVAILAEELSPVAAKFAVEAAEATALAFRNRVPVMTAKIEAVVGCLVKDGKRFTDFDNLANLASKQAGAETTFVELMSGRPVTCQAKTIDESLITLENWLGRPIHVYANGSKLGRLDRTGKFAEADFPFHLKTANVSLSDGRALKISSDRLDVIHWVPRSKCPVSVGPGMYKSSNVKAVQSAPLGDVSEMIKPWKRLTFGEAVATEPGTVLTHEFPFQWIGDELTNGVTSIPRIRPSLAAQRAALGLPKVTAANWGKFLGQVEARFGSEAF